MLSLDDLRNCLSAVGQAVDSAKFSQSYVLHLCDGDTGALPYRRAVQATQRLDATRRQLFREIEALERQATDG